MTSDPSQLTESLDIAALILDAAVQLVRFLLKALLLAGLTIFVSKREAEVRLKPTILTTFAIVALTFLFNTSPTGTLGVYQYFIVSFIATIIVRKVFWIEVDKALIASFLFVFFSVTLTDYSERGLDKLMEDRATIGRTVAALIDARSVALTGDDSLPPSRRVLPALIRLSDDPNDEGSGIIHDMMAPMRAAKKAKQKIAEIDKVAHDQASIVNMLSGAGTNVGDRASELKALEQSLANDDAAGRLPTTPGVPSGMGATSTYQEPAAASPMNSAEPTPNGADAPAAPAPQPARKRPAAPPPPTGSGDTMAEAFAKAIFSIKSKFSKDDDAVPETATPASQPAAPTPTPKPAPSKPAQPTADTVVASVTTAEMPIPEVQSLPKGPVPDAPAPVEAVNADAVTTVPSTEPTRPTSTNNIISVPMANLAGLSPEKRALWEAARATIHISAKGWSAGGAYAYVDGRFIQSGTFYTVIYEGQPYEFQFQGVGENGENIWVPVLKPEEVKEVEEIDMITF
ncbi:MAG: hypothetical protein O3A51_07095 [Verrucomicrobia bacterium]|nr:hypothetical protein [Verrucomicrobiota bacterium]